ncbi:MAG: RNA methyltransferase [Propionicimonas sp.]|uniref:TrmH family RNA methyltransferase n=1 Tax=Propionicimonas sp. TaxID=1955623 RepID=UPI002B1F621E|nr:RNA methyltransferase [Propionicimonas sp.]MEA4943075.1 RNA methyltransferase [Propionicimonas sp.]MEA5118142.1 RNA methyltransferase [Propionicimonas sp.]
MATLLAVTDPGDPRLADYVRLRETSLRRLLETEHGLFIAEGAKVIRRALEAGYQPRSFLLAERWLADLADLLDQIDAPVYLVTEELAEQVTGFHVHRGALASLHRHDRYTVADILARSRRLVVLEDLVDHTNVGAVIRNAAGLGWDGLLVSPRCADPLYRRSIKVSMGAVFSLPWARLAGHRDAPELLHEAGFTVAALALAEDAVELAGFASRLGASDKVAILLGTEGDGLSRRWIKGADTVVRIPMRAGIDSLNVAAASAIACYALAP